MEKDQERKVITVLSESGWMAGITSSRQPQTPAWRTSMDCCREDTQGSYEMVTFYLAENT